MFRLLKLANRPDQVTIQARPLPEIFFGNGLQERCGVASSFTVDEEFTGEELAQANGPTFHGDRKRDPGSQGSHVGDIVNVHGSSRFQGRRASSAFAP